MDFNSYFINVALKNNINRIYIEAEGGFGKSFGLKKLCCSMARNFQDYSIVPIYIDVKKLTDLTVEEYITREYCYAALDKFTELYSVFRDNNYKYLIVLDGLNEASEAVCNTVIYGFIDSVIEEKTDYNNLFIVVASRFYDKSMNNILDKAGYKHIKYKSLDKHIVEDFVKKELSSYSEDLINVLKNPMMLSIFSNTARKDRYNNAKHQSDVLDLFFEEQIEKASGYRKYSSEEKILFEFVIAVFLPVLLEENKYIYTKSQIKNSINSVSKNKVFANKIITNDYDEIDYDFRVIMKILRDDLKLFSKSGTNLIIHQIFNDYFISKYYFEEIMGWIEKPYDNPEFVFSSYNDIGNCKFRRLSYSIKDYLAHLTGDALKVKVPDKLRISKLSTEKYIIAQTVEILKVADNLNGCDFSYLNLEYCNFRHCSMQRVNFSNAQITENSFHLPVRTMDKIEFYIIDSSEDYLVLDYNGDILCVSLKDYSVIYLIKANNCLNNFVKFNRSEIILVLQNKFEIYDLEFGFRKREIFFYDIFDECDISYTDFYYDVDCDVYVCYNSNQNKIAILDSNFEVLFYSYINNSEYKLRYFNGNGVVYNNNSVNGLYDWSIIDIDLKNKTINISDCIISTDSCELQFLLCQNKLFVCGMIAQKLVSINVTDNKKTLIQNIKGINYCNNLYKNIKTLSVYMEDYNDNSLCLDDMISIVDDKIIDLVFEEEYERYLCEKCKTENEYQINNVSNKLHQNFSSRDAFCIELFEEDGFNLVGFLNHKHLLKEFKQYSLFPISDKKYLIYSQNNTCIIINASGEELGRFNLNNQIIETTYFDSYSDLDYDELYLETANWTMLYDLKNICIKKKSILAQDYVSTFFMNDYAFEKKIVNALKNIYDLPSEIRVMKEGKDNLWYFYDKIDIGKISDMHFVEPKMYINAQFGTTVIFSVFHMVYTDLPIDIRRVFNGDKEYIKKNEDIISSFSFSDYERNEVIDVFVGEYDFQKKSLIVKSKLNEFFNAKLYCVVPCGYRQIDDKTILILKFLKSNEYRFIIYNKTKNVVFDRSYYTKENIITTDLTKKVLYIVFENSICVININPFDLIVKKSEEKIVSACQYRNNSLFVLYDSNKVAKIVFDFKEQSAIFENTLIVIPMSDLKGASFDNTIVKYNSGDFINLIKYNC